MWLIWIEDWFCTKGTGSSAVEPNRAQAEGKRWSSRTLIYFSAVRRLLIWWIAPAPSKENYPHTGIDFRPLRLTENVCPGTNRVPFVRITNGRPHSWDLYRVWNNT
jgi:hypothetical protein